MPDINRLVLIDGHAILHRAFHALPPLTNKEGLQTNAVYGFTTTLLRILDDLRPTHLAVAFDLPGPIFRQQLWTQYQEKRPEMQSNLAEQIPLVHELLGTLKIQYYEVAGYEADDVIGTLATQAVDFRKTLKTQKIRGSDKSDTSDSQKPRPSELSELSGISEVVIVTGDRDMLQLINSRVKVYVPIKGLSEAKTYDDVAVRAEYRVAPCQWVDVKALKGDASDNYPGVRGVGPKTAEKLIAEFGTLENLYAQVDKLDQLDKFGKNLAKKLAEGAEMAGLSKKLATIVTDVPVHLDLDKAGIMGIDWNLGIKFMRERLGFRSIAERAAKIYLEGRERDNGQKTKDKGQEKGKQKKDGNNAEQLGLI